MAIRQTLKFQKFFHQPRCQFSTTKNVNKSSKLKKFGIVAGLAGISGSAYYMTLDDIEKRRVRVSVGGIRRFFRYGLYYF